MGYAIILWAKERHRNNQQKREKAETKRAMNVDADISYAGGCAVKRMNIRRVGFASSLNGSEKVRDIIKG